MSACKQQETPCTGCWCYTCAEIARCLKSGHACFGCSDKPLGHRAKPKEAGICAGYILEETPAKRDKNACK